MAIQLSYFGKWLMTSGATCTTTPATATATSIVTSDTRACRRFIIACTQLGVFIRHCRRGLCRCRECIGTHAVVVWLLCVDPDDYQHGGEYEPYGSGCNDLTGVYLHRFFLHGILQYQTTYVCLIHTSCCIVC